MSPVEVGLVVQLVLLVVGLLVLLGLLLALGAGHLLYWLLH